MTTEEGAFSGVESDSLLDILSRHAKAHVTDSPTSNTFTRNSCVVCPPLGR